MLKKIPEIIAELKKSLNTLTAKEAAIKCAEINGIMIDVREPAEYQKQSADSAINIPRGILEMKMLELYPNAEQAIFIHCASGVRATFAAEQLLRVGYQNVWVITCKIEDVCKG